MLPLHKWHLNLNNNTYTSLASHSCENSFVLKHVQSSVIQIQVPFLKKVYTVQCMCQGIKLTFFAGSQLAPKYVKVVANSKKLVAIMTHTQKSTFHALINFHDKRDQNSLLATKRTLEWFIYNIKGFLNPRWRLVTIIVHVLHFGNGLNEELCCRFIFTNLQQLLDLQVRCDQKFQSPIWRLIFRIWSPK